MKRQPAIELAIDLQHITVKRGGRALLRNVNWSVPAGACAAILGPNGSGKSTLARVIMGQMWPTAGKVSVLGEPFGESDLGALRQSIRLVQPSGGIEIDPEQTTLDVVLTGFFGTVGLYDIVTPPMRTAAIRLLNQVGLKLEMNQPYRTLSSGERMRCLIARALAVKPRLLILDEPTSGLDVLAREQVLATLHELIKSSKQPPAVLMITHHVEELLPNTTQVLVLKMGRVAASGAPSAVLQSKILSDVYQFPVQVVRKSGRFWLSVKRTAWKGLIGRSD